MTEYILVRLEDNIKDNALLIYDADTDTLRDSGLTAVNGDIQAAPSTVKVGLHDISSQGEQVIWRNRASEVNYAPPWHVVDEVNPGGSFDRFYGNLQNIVRESDNSSVLEDPSFSIDVPIDEIIFALTFEGVEAKSNVICRIYGSTMSMPVWQQYIEVQVGLQTIELDTPVALKAGNYLVELVSLDGDPVRLLGNPATGIMAYTVTMRLFEDKPIASQEYVDTAITENPKGFKFVVSASQLDGSDTNYQTATDSVPETIPINDVDIFIGESNNVILGNGVDELTINDSGLLQLSYSAHLKGQGSGKFASWLEVSTDGVSWVPIKNSGIVVDAPRNKAISDKNPSAFSYLNVNVGDKIRGRHVRIGNVDSVYLASLAATQETPQIPAWNLNIVKIND